MQVEWKEARRSRGASCAANAQRRRRGGFTLLETALAIVIVGVGVLAMVAAQQAFHQKNSWSTHAAIASSLGNEIRELTLNLPRHDPVTGAATWGPETGELWVGDYDDLDDFDGTGGGIVFSASLGNGPINARREVIANMEGWSQTVSVYSVDPFDINTTVTDGTTNVMMVEVVIEYQSPQDITPQELTRVKWIAPN